MKIIRLMVDKDMSFDQIDLEESGRDEDGFIPPTARYVWSAGEWHADRGQLVVKMTRAVPNEDGTPYRLELDLSV